jgi:hypothetical protein
MIVHSRPNYVNYDKDGRRIDPAVPPRPDPVYPIAVRLPPQPLHYIEVLEGQSRRLHAVRVEFKTDGELTR